MTTISLKKLDVELNSGSRKFQLKNIDLDIQSGEMVVVAGPSGVGKSTLLKAIAGLVDITSGEIYFDDQRMDTLKAAERKMGMVFQNFSLFPHYDVAKNLALGLVIKGSDKVQINQKVKEAAKKLHIEHLLDSFPKTLSGGQKQRVAIGRAILSEPKVFLFDEPLSNLDHGLRAELRKEIRQLHNGLNTTSLFVTHDQHEAFSLADRIVLMSDKGIEQFDTPQNIYQSPASLFAAQFFGMPHLNCFEGVCQKGEVKLDIGLTVAQPLPEKYLGEKVTVAIRPSKVFMLKHKGISATVVSVEQQPEAVWVTAKLSDSADNESYATFVSSDVGLEIGQAIKLGAKAEDLMFFDRDGIAIN